VFENEEFTEGVYRGIIIGRNFIVKSAKQFFKHKHNTKNFHMKIPYRYREILKQPLCRQWPCYAIKICLTS